MEMAIQKGKRAKEKMIGGGGGGGGSGGDG